MACTGQETQWCTFIFNVLCSWLVSTTADYVIHTNTLPSCYTIYNVVGEWTERFVRSQDNKQSVYLLCEIVLASLPGSLNTLCVLLGQRIIQCWCDSLHPVHTMRLRLYLLQTNGHMGLSSRCCNHTMWTLYPYKNRNHNRIVWTNLYYHRHNINVSRNQIWWKRKKKSSEVHCTFCLTFVDKKLCIASFYQRVITSTSNNSLYTNIHLSDICIYLYISKPCVLLLANCVA